MTIEENALQIIKESTYMTLATSSDNTPWACALFFGVDSDYNFYFVFSCQSMHVQNVLKNRKVALTIFDSHAISGHANGVQISGTCERLTGKVIQAGIDAIYAKRYSDPADRANRSLTVEEFSKSDVDPSAHHIYKIKPGHIYTLDKAKGEDFRVEVKI